MWTDGIVTVADYDPYTDARGTQYPGNFPKSEISGLTYVEDLPVVPTIDEIQEQIVNKTQLRLDSFARTRNYDSILSACTYATSNVSKFKSEGQYCVDVRDATWEALYQFMTSVETGYSSMPTGFSDVEPLLPVLKWPE